MMEIHIFEFVPKNTPFYANEVLRENTAYHFKKRYLENEKSTLSYRCRKQEGGLLKIKP